MPPQLKFREGGDYMPYPPAPHTHLPASPVPVPMYHATQYKFIHNIINIYKIICIIYFSY